MMLVYISELGLVFCDLRAGVKKAKQLGQYRSSEGYRRTIDKIARYFNMTFALSLIDAVMLAIVFYVYYFYKVDIWMLPIFTMVAGGYVAFVEVKSIWEPASIKEAKLMKGYRGAIIQLIKEYGSIENVIAKLAEAAIKDKSAEGSVDIIDKSPMEDIET